MVNLHHLPFAINRLPFTILMIYLDYAATTPVRPEVIDAMMPYWTEHYGNPSSVHAIGQRARRGLDGARRQIAGLLGARPHEIIFTSGATESCNLALRGVMRPDDHLITTPIEHKAVLDTAKTLNATFAAVSPHGIVDPNEIDAHITPSTRLISVQAANNEIGSIQPIEQIGAVAHERGILFHTDAVQMTRFREWRLDELPIDLMSIAPHKFGGVKGVGVLVVRDGVKLEPMLTGGGQERGVRPGTSNVAFAVGAAEALRLAMAEREQYAQHCIALRDKLIDGVLQSVPADIIQLTGHHTERLPHIASFALKHLKGNDLLMHLDLAGISASSGSACTVGNPEPSHVLEAIGLGSEWIDGSLRFSVGGETTSGDIDTILQKLPKIITTLRRISVNN